MHRNFFFTNIMAWKKLSGLQYLISTLFDLDSSVSFNKGCYPLGLEEKRLFGASGMILTTITAPATWVWRNTTCISSIRAASSLWHETWVPLTLSLKEVKRIWRQCPYITEILSFSLSYFLHSFLLFSFYFDKSLISCHRML